MNIVNNLKGKFAIGVFLIAGGVIGIFFLRNAELVILGLLSVSCFFVLLRYPVLGILSLMVGTSLIDYYQGLPFTKIGSLQIPDLILFLLVVVVIFRTLFLRVKPIRTPLDIPVFIFVGIGTASLLAGALEQKYLFFAGLRDFKPILYYLLVILVTNIIKDKKELKLVIYGCLALGIIAVGRVVLAGWVNPPTALSDAEEMFYRYKVVSSGSMLPFWSLVAFVSLLLMSKIRLGYILGAGILLIWLMLSFTRHLWIAFGVGVLWVVLFNFRKVKKRIFVYSLLIIISISLVATASFFEVEPVATYVNLIALRGKSLTFQKKVENWEFRLAENEYSLPKIAEHPLFGIGFAVPYRPQIFGPDDNLQSYLHNGYLWILIKLGIAGLIPFLWFSYVFVRRGIIYRNRVEDNFLRAVVLGSVCSYLGIAIGNIAAAHFMENWEVSVFALSMGINEVIYRLEGVDAGR
jgi:O-antigen ligase